MKIAIANFKRYKPQSSGQILAEEIQAGGNTLLSEFHKLIHSILNKKNRLVRGRSVLLY
jgi:plasmid maintenance system antidote protein VapI